MNSSLNLNFPSHFGRIPFQTTVGKGSDYGMTDAWKITLGLFATNLSSTVSLGTLRPRHLDNHRPLASSQLELNHTHFS